MTIAAVITEGLGPSASVKYLITVGFDLGESVDTTGGVPKKKRYILPDGKVVYGRPQDIDRFLARMEEVDKRDVSKEAPQTVQKAPEEPGEPAKSLLLQQARLVMPQAVVEPPRTPSDWAALERMIAALLEEEDLEMILLSL